MATLKNGLNIWHIARVNLMTSHADLIIGQNKKAPGREMSFIDSPFIEKLKYIHQSQYGGSQHHYLICTS